MPRPRWIQAAVARVAAPLRTAKERERALEAGYLDYLVNEDEFGEAEWDYRAVLEIQVRLLGADHPDTLSTRTALADTLVQRHLQDQAERECRIVLDARMRALGAEHPDTLTTRDALAHALYRPTMFDEAERQFRLVLEARTRTLGANDPDTLAARRDPADLVSERERRV